VTAQDAALSADAAAFDEQFFDAADRPLFPNP
jgi:hypothetical protein